jgi:hypothetical protein
MSLALAVPRNGLCRIGGQRLYGDHDFLERLHDALNLVLLGHCHPSPLKLDMRSSQIVLRRLTSRMSREQRASLFAIAPCESGAQCARTRFGC